MVVESRNDPSVIGLIPEGWIEITLGEVFEFKNGLNKGKEFFGQGTPIINYMDVYKSRGLYSKNIKGRVNLSKQEIRNFEVRKGDVFFTRTSETLEEVGIPSILLDEAVDTVFSGFVLRARHKFDLLDQMYEKYCYATKLVREQIISKGTYTTRALTNGRALSTVKLTIPSEKKEQQAIAEVLSDMDAYIDSLEQLIAKKRMIKQGVMQELLTGKRRLLGFSAKWEEIPFSEMLDYERPDNYIVKSTEYLSSGKVPVLTANKSFILGFTDEIIGIYTDLPVIIFDDFTTDNKFVDFPFKVKSSAIKILKNKSEEYNLRFIYERMQLLNFVIGDHKRYYISEYQFQKILMPKIVEQNAITDVLSDMQKEIDQLIEKLSKVQKIKDGMMQELLTGRIRLV